VRKLKHILLAAFAAGLPAVLQAQQQPDGGWYLGSGLVLPKPRPELRIIPHPSESRETLESSLQQFGGYRFDRNWSVDVGYTATSQSSAWTLAGSGLLPIGRSFSLQGHLGLALPAADNSISSATDALTGLASLDPAKARAGLLWGFGGQYEFSPGMGLRMDFNSRYGEDPVATRARTDLWSINAVVRF
jgi:Outer membrane protein beta-barrel domain